MPPNVSPALAPLTLMVVVVAAGDAGAAATPPASTRQTAANTYPVTRRTAVSITVLLCYLVREMSPTPNRKCVTDHIDAQRMMPVNSGSAGQRAPRGNAAGRRPRAVGKIVSGLPVGVAVCCGLPVAVPDDLVDRATVGLDDRPQRAVGRVPHAQQVGHIMVVGHAEDLTGPLLVADRGMAGADAEVGGRDHHGVGGLPKVVSVDQASVVIVDYGDDQRD